MYAKELSKNAFITFVFDHRTYGESGGEPRHYKNPYMKVEDVKNAVSYVGSLHVVDKNKIGLLGIWNGGAFGAAAAIYDKRVKAYASVSGIFDMRSKLLMVNLGTKKNYLILWKNQERRDSKIFWIWWNWVCKTNDKGQEKFKSITKRSSWILSDFQGEGVKLGQELDGSI